MKPKQDNARKAGDSSRSEIQEIIAEAFPDGKLPPYGRLPKCEGSIGETLSLTAPDPLAAECLALMDSILNGRYVLEGTLAGRPVTIRKPTAHDDRYSFRSDEISGWYNVKTNKLDVRGFSVAPLSLGDVIDWLKEFQRDGVVHHTLSDNLITDYEHPLRAFLCYLLDSPLELNVGGAMQLKSLNIDPATVNLRRFVGDDYMAFEQGPFLSVDSLTVGPGKHMSGAKEIYELNIGEIAVTYFYGSFEGEGCQDISTIHRKLRVKDGKLENMERQFLGEAWS